MTAPQIPAINDLPDHTPWQFSGNLSIFAGLPLAGKSTVINMLRNKFLDVVVFEEGRQMVLKKNGRPEMCAPNLYEQIDIIHCNLQKLYRVLVSNYAPLTWFEETNVFHLAEARAQGNDSFDGYTKAYEIFLRKMNTHIIYLDIDPEVSWERFCLAQKAKNLSVDAALTQDFFREYTKTLGKLKKEHLKLLKRLTCQATIINANAAIEQVLSQVENALKQFNLCEVAQL